MSIKAGRVNKRDVDVQFQVRHSYGLLKVNIWYSNIDLRTCGKFKSFSHPLNKFNCPVCLVPPSLDDLRMRKFSIHRNVAKKCVFILLTGVNDFFIHHVPEQWFPLISTNNNSQPRDDSTKREKKRVKNSWESSICYGKLCYMEIDWIQMMQFSSLYGILIRYLSHLCILTKQFNSNEKWFFFSSHLIGLWRKEKRILLWFMIIILSNIQ